MKNIRLGEVLVESGYLTQQQVDEALNVQRSSGGKKLGDILLDLGVISEEQLHDALQKRLHMPGINLMNVNISNEALSLVPEEFARANNLIPVKVQGNELIVATSNPLNYYGLNDLEVMTALSVTPQIAIRSEVDSAIDKFYANSSTKELASNATEHFSDVHDIGSADFSEAELRASSAPIVRLVNTLVEQAYRSRASDIHIEPDADYVRVRFRVDGELSEIMTLKTQLLAPIITRIKISANLDIAEKRLPQDGRMKTEVDGTEVNIRVSTISTVYGEKAVLRLLADSGTGVMSIKDLGMNAHNEHLLRKLLQSPNGIILVTGPTGSGKSTTLYAALSALCRDEVNIVSVEDPVEKIIHGANQTQVNPKAGLTFASGLRALLRQDPDIMMVGEIRDEETASIAAAAAITGHLVLSSLHTNDAASAYMRFIDMGVASYIVASSIVGVVAQRLVRCICTHCRTEYTPTEDELNGLKAMGIEGVDKLYIGKGCPKCDFTGHYGRTGIYEIITTDSKVRNMVTDNEKTQEIRDHLSTNGFLSMRDNAVELMREGVITYKEMLLRTYSVEDM